jgi:hypothetical protein
MRPDRLFAALCFALVMTGACGDDGGEGSDRSTPSSATTPQEAESSENQEEIVPNDTPGPGISPNGTN